MDSEAERSSLGTEPPGGFIEMTGNGAIFIGQMSISPDGRQVALGAGSFWAWLRRRWNAQSNLPLTKRRVRVTIEDLEAEA